MKIVLSGSGTLYPVHWGGVMRLLKEGRPVEAVAGTSGGAIVASLVAAGHAPQDITRIILDTLPGENDLIDWSFMPWRRWGLIKGDRLLNEFKKYIPPRLGDAVIPLRIFVVDPTSGETVEFDSEFMPNAAWPQIVRASMSIPFIFKYHVYRGFPSALDGVPMIDGGVGNNFAIDAFSGDDVVGLRLVPAREGRRDVKGLTGYVGSIINSFMAANLREHIEDAYWARVISIPVEGDSTNFKMNRQEANDLIVHGFRAVDKALTEDEAFNNTEPDDVP